jgi:hypothetical protein
VLYSQSGFYKERPDLLNKLKQLLEVDLGEAEELAKANSRELRRHSNTNMGTIVLSTPGGAYEKADRVAEGRGEAVDPSRSRRRAKAGKIAGGRGGVTDQSRVEEWKDRAASVLL